MKPIAVGLLLTAFVFLLLVPFVSTSQPAKGESWSEVLRKRKGTLTVYWYESRPFIYRSGQDQIAGIEFEMIPRFQKYLKDKHDVALSIEWHKAESFSSLYKTIGDPKANGILGASAFSITNDRRKVLDFSPAYMSDITVFITSNDIPIVKNVEEFSSLLPDITAITIKETTYEQELPRMRDKSSFRIRYIHSSENILRTIERSDSTFGFIDLPVYMLLFNEDLSLRVKRQNIFTIKREGYALVYPKNSDWSIPVNEFFADSIFTPELEKIIGRYIDIDLYRFVEGLTEQSSDGTVELLTKEKEIQSKDLISKARLLVTETRKTNFLIALLVTVMVFLIIIVVLYRKRNEQKLKIEAQQKNIELKSEHLKNETIICWHSMKKRII